MLEEKHPSEDIFSMSQACLQHVLCAFRMVVILLLLLIFKNKSTGLNHHRGLNDVENSTDAPLMKIFFPYT